MLESIQCVHGLQRPNVDYGPTAAYRACTHQSEWDRQNHLSHYCAHAHPIRNTEMFGRSAVTPADYSTTAL